MVFRWVWCERVPPHDNRMLDDDKSISLAITQPSLTNARPQLAVEVASAQVTTDVRHCRLHPSTTVEALSDFQRPRL